MENLSGELKSVKLDLNSFFVTVIADDGTGLEGIGYTCSKD